MLRPIVPLPRVNLQGFSPASIDVDAPTIEWVDPTTLLVDEVYQRRISNRGYRQIRRIYAEWRWDRFKPPICVRTPDGILVVDGQHTAIAAATHPGIDRIPVVINAMAVVAAQAAAFVGHNEDNLQITRPQLFYSRLAAEDPSTVEIERVLHASGCRVRRVPPPKRDGFDPGDTVAVETLYQIYHRRGAENLGTMLGMLRTRAPISFADLRALELLMTDPDYRSDWDPVAIEPIVRASSGYEQREAQAIALTHTKPVYVALAMVWYRRVPRRQLLPQLRRA